MEELNEAIQKIIDAWNAFTSTFDEMTKAVLSAFSDLRELAYEGVSNPPIKYASRMKKNHIYRDRKPLVCQVNGKPRKHQQYYRR